MMGFLFQPFLLEATLIKGVFKISPLLSSHPQPPVKEPVGGAFKYWSHHFHGPCAQLIPELGCFHSRTGPLPCITPYVIAGEGFASGMRCSMLTSQEKSICRDGALSPRFCNRLETHKKFEICVFSWGEYTVGSSRPASDTLVGWNQELGELRCVVDPSAISTL